MSEKERAPSAINERWVEDMAVVAIGERVWRNGKPHAHDLIRFSDALRDTFYTAAQPAAHSDAPGSPAARFAWLMAELEKRLPDPEPWSARVPEMRYMAALDKMLASPKADEPETGSAR